MRFFASVLISAVLFTCVCQAQQVPLYSQYILNEFLINPSVAGVDGMTTVNLSGRKQWVGIRNTPETYSASISGRILKSPLSIVNSKVKKATSGRVGLGMAVTSDQNGAIQRTNLKLVYAYHIFINNNQLSFGLEGIAGQFRISDNLAEFRDEQDPLTAVLGESAFIPDFGVGVNYSIPSGHLGISVTNIFQSNVKFSSFTVKNSELQNIRQYTAFGVYKLRIENKEWEFEPSTLIRGNEDLRFNADFTARFIYKREYWAGISYRTTNDIVVLTGLKVNRMYIGYSFDYGFHELSRSSYGSHEIVIALKLGDSVRRYRWLERY